MLLRYRVRYVYLGQTPRSALRDRTNIASPSENDLYERELLQSSTRPFTRAGAGAGGLHAKSSISRGGSAQHGAGAALKEVPKGVSRAACLYAVAKQARVRTLQHAECFFKYGRHFGLERVSQISTTLIERRRPEAITLSELALRSITARY